MNFSSILFYFFQLEKNKNMLDGAEEEAFFVLYCLARCEKLKNRYCKGMANATQKLLTENV